MTHGPNTRALTPHQIDRLEKFRRASHDGAPHGYSPEQLRLAMGAKFGWRTLRKALQGRPVRYLFYAYIAQWIERYLPGAPAVRDGKAAASGEYADEDTAPMGDGRSKSVDQ